MAAVYSAGVHGWYRLLQWSLSSRWSHALGIHGAALASACLAMLTLMCEYSVGCLCNSPPVVSAMSASGMGICVASLACTSYVSSVCLALHIIFLISLALPGGVMTFHCACGYDDTFVEPASRSHLRACLVRLPFGTSTASTGVFDMYVTSTVVCDKYSSMACNGL